MNPVALVTGGASGIGLGISFALAKEGYHLAICGRRSIETIKTALEQLESTGAVVRYYVCDITLAQNRADLLTALKTDFGCLNVLVNNAGIAPEKRVDLLEASEESFDRLITTNLKGPYFLTQATAQWMIAQKETYTDFRGCIINISSISAEAASVNRGEYCISKAGVSMATKLWAVRLAEFGIPVYEVRPGIIATDMTAAIKEKYDQLIAEGLLLEPRWGTPEDVGSTVAALAAGKIPYATGQVLTVDGGLSLRRL